MKKLISLLCFFILLSNQWAFSQEDNEKHPILTDKYQFAAGLFYPSKSIGISAEGNLPVDDIDFGTAFGLDDSETTLFLGFDWRFAKKWKLSFEYFGMNTEKSRVLKEDIYWEDIIFKEGSNIKGGTGLSVYRIYVGRIFSRGNKHEFGGGLGVHAMSVKVFLEGTAYINDEIFSGHKSSKSITLPLPNLGLWYYYTPIPKLALIARLDVFAISIGEYSGSLWDIAPGIQYQVFKHFGAALNYRYIKLNAGFDSADWTGDVNIIFQGPSFTITGNF